MGRTVYLLNDTRGSWHTGSDAVMDVLERLCAEAGLEIVGRHPVGVEQVSPAVADADVVLVNGEGTLHHGKGGHLVQALADAQARGQATGLVNAVWHHPEGFPGSWLPVLENADLLVARDPLSAKALDRSLVCADSVELMPDLSIDTAPALTSPSPRWPVLGNAYVSWLRETDLAAVAVQHTIWRCGSFTDAVQRLHQIDPVAYVTGEHHGCYAAILAGVPFVPIPGNSWKIEGLCAWPTKTPYPIDVAHDIDGVLRGIEQAREGREQFAAWREDLLAWPRLTAEHLRAAFGL